MLNRQKRHRPVECEGRSDAHRRRQVDEQIERAGHPVSGKFPAGMAARRARHYGKSHNSLTALDGRMK